MTSNALRAVTQADWDRCRSVISERFGWVFADAREVDLHRAIHRASNASGAGDVTAYVNRLLAGTLADAEVERLVAELTVGETYFFRDHGCFDRLEHDVVPQLVEARRSGTRQIRIWSAGCSTGEEPYSIAMLLDRIIPDITGWHVTILGTDINRRSLEKAKAGVYREWSLRDTPQWVRDRYFLRTRDGRFEVTPGIRARVTFAYLNLVADVFPSFFSTTNAMDVIVCRNVLMYLGSERRQQIIDKFHRTLVDGGYLIVSPTECFVPDSSHFEAVPRDLTTFHRKRVGRGMVPASGRIAPTASSPLPLPSARVQRSHLGPRPRRRDGVPASSSVAVPQPVDVATSLARARESANQGRLEDARRWCELALEEDRLDPAAHYLLASIRLEHGDTAAAIGALTNAIYSDANFVLAHFLLGSILWRGGERQKARRCFQTVVGLLRSEPADTLVPAGEGMSAGRLTELANWYLRGEHAS